ncbi:ABC transporter permease subunit [Demequina sp. NBRC 110056]|uniref:ABC transporter permease subunit n=1 Tax=Demequina sp. NBRC 110056 TaxID=1570345 RepID=UPI000A014BDA|nr:ABC transporter permease subunit [Demequina sp. NBRC 110056]
MLRSVYLKSIRDRWLGAMLGVVALFAVAWMGIWSFAGMGDEALAFIDAMPPAYLSLTGISADAGVAGMMLSNMFTFMGPFVIAGIGVSMGAAAIAGEEAAGTMNVLGAAPRSRSRLLRSKALAIVSIVVGAGVLASVSYVLAAAVSSESITALNLAAATVHMLAVCLLFAAVALAVGAWTGNRALASGTGVGLIAVSFLASGLLPLVEGFEDWAKVSPWYWIDGTDPLTTGVDWTPVVIILAAAAAVGALGWWGLRRRDLGSGLARVPMLERLRSDPRLGRAVAMLSGRGSTRGVASRALTDLRPILIVACSFAAFQAIVLGLLFNAISADIGPFVEAMPESILAMVGFADFSTPEGWYYGEALSIVAPVVVSIVAITAGAALAREERDRTASVLLTLPISRTSVAWRKALAILTGSLVVGAVVSLSILAGNALAGLGMDPWHILSAGVLLAGLGLVLGGAAFLAGGLTGRHSLAVGVGTGVAVVGWGINSFVPVNPDLAHWAQVSPFYYYTDGNPLEIGMTWWHLGVLVGVGAVLIAAGAAAYRARDLRG